MRKLTRAERIQLPALTDNATNAACLQVHSGGFGQELLIGTVNGYRMAALNHRDSLCWRGPELLAACDRAASHLKGNGRSHVNRNRSAHDQVTLVEALNAAAGASTTSQARTIRACSLAVTKNV
jgi:hypothetical protein